jgi:hypothetical protein
VRTGPVLILDPRGMGESVKHANHLTSDSIVLGRPLFAQQIWDVIQARSYIADRDDVDGARISLHGDRQGGLLALYAAALDGDVAQVEATNVLASYRYFLEDEQPQPIALCIPNVLNVIDIPQVAALVAPRPLNVSGVVGYGLAGLSSEDTAREWAFTTAAYQVAGNEGALHLK